MAQGSQVSINGSTDLSQIIVGPSGANVQSITYENFTGIARSSVFYVYGMGPKGMGSGSLKVTVVTAANESHDLNLTSSSLEVPRRQVPGRHQHHVDQLGPGLIPARRGLTCSTGCCGGLC
jgi:hypothetical protein